jgi:hypothetical protein
MPDNSDLTRWAFVRLSAIAMQAVVATLPNKALHRTPVNARRCFGLAFGQERDTAVSGCVGPRRRGTDEQNAERMEMECPRRV